MTTTVNGFELEVTTSDAAPHVRISLRSGEVVIDTDRVSVTGLHNLSAVFERAASVAFRQLESYYARRHAEALRQRTGAGSNVAEVL